MNEKDDWEIQREIQDSLKVCREIQEYVKREKKERPPGRIKMNPDTRSGIDQILKSLEQTGEAAKPVPLDGFPVTDRTREPLKPAVPVSEEPVKPAVPVPEEPVKPAVPVPEEPVKPASPVPEEPVKPERKPPKGKKPKKKRTATQPVFMPNEDKSEHTEEEYNERHPFMRASLHVLVCIALALLIALVITKFIAHHTSVEGSSMESTLKSGDELIVQKLSYYFHDPERFDVVVFPYNETTNYIKRVIGLPGETVQIINGIIYINGEILNESYGSEMIEDPGIAAEEIHLGDDEYFVLGDNRNASIDSRKKEIGMIPGSKILGKAWLRFYPFDTVSLIE